jgi:hypothetical protein
MIKRTSYSGNTKYCQQCQTFWISKLLYVIIYQAAKMLMFGLKMHVMSVSRDVDKNMVKKSTLNFF